MVTGIECAGIVLAVFPLLATGIQTYSNGMRSISRARKYQSILGKYSLDLSREYTEFRNTWFRIVELADFNSDGLRRIAPDLSLQIFRETPQYAVAGQNIDLKTILSLALQSFDVAGLNEIERTIEELSRLIKELAMDFNLITIRPDGHWHPMIVPTSPDLASGSTQTGHVKNIKATLKSLAKMLETELGSDYRDERLSQIREQNMYLSRLITGDTIAQIALVRDRPRSRTSINMSQALGHTRLYNEIQHQAKALHSILQQKFEASTIPCCQRGHGGFLLLEVRGVSIKIPAMASNLRHICYRFGLCFSFKRPTLQPEEVDPACELELEILNGHENHGGNPKFDSSQPTPPILDVQITLAVDARGAGEGGSQRNGKQVEVSKDMSQMGEGVQPLPLCSQASSSEAKGGIFKFRLPVISSQSKRTANIAIHSSPQNQASMEDSSKSRTKPRLFGRGASSRASSSNTGTDVLPDSSANSKKIAPKEDNRLEILSSNVCIPQTVTSHLDPNSLHRFHPSPEALTARPWLCQACVNPNDNIIDSVCGAARATIQEQKWQGCVGILSNAGDLKVRVCPRKGKQLKMEPIELVSLQTLLSQCRKPSAEERLKLAVLLASSVMQLHETNWLNKLWCSNDIFFKGTDAKNFRLAEPYLKRTFQATQAREHQVAQEEDEWSDCILCCNETLFKLGITLIEIHHWKPFQTLENGRRKSQAVRETVTELFKNAGANYGLSVKTCVQGLPGMEMDLGHEGFKNEVYEKIVAPLEDDLKHFCGTKDLSTIFCKKTVFSVGGGASQ